MTPEAPSCRLPARVVAARGHALAVGHVRRHQRVSNQASVSFVMGGVPGSAQSNPTTFLVGEILDPNVTRQSSTVSVSAGDINRELLVPLTNTGNGSETFPLAIDNLIAGDDFDPQAAAPRHLLRQRRQRRSVRRGRRYVPGSNDPTLAPDASIAGAPGEQHSCRLADGALGRSRLHARAATGTGTPGTVIPRPGRGWHRRSGRRKRRARPRPFGEYLVGDVQVSLAKSVTVMDPAGGTQCGAWRALNYQIVVNASGSGTAHHFVLTDAIPAGTTYPGGSLRLNGSRSPMPRMLMPANSRLARRPACAYRSATLHRRRPPDHRLHCDDQLSLQESRHETDEELCRGHDARVRRDYGSAHRSGLHPAQDRRGDRTGRPPTSAARRPRAWCRPRRSFRETKSSTQ